MRFNVIGWNFKKTPIEVRERLALTRVQQIELANRLKESFKLGGIVILSTCNRTEFFLANAEQQLDQIIEMLQKYWNIPDLRESIYILQNLDASRHLFRVASSLDSMVLGEPQILGQLKDTFHSFSEAELTGFDSFAAASEAVSYLAEDTAFDAHERHLAEQAELRRRFKSKVHTREKSFDAPAAGETMQNGLAQHPWLANQRFDGIDPNLNPEPPLNSEARREFDNAKREQEMEKQLRLGNMPAFSSSPKPKPS